MQESPDNRTSINPRMYLLFIDKGHEVFKNSKIQKKYHVHTAAVVVCIGVQACGGGTGHDLAAYCCAFSLSVLRFFFSFSRFTYDLNLGCCWMDGACAASGCFFWRTPYGTSLRA